MGIATTTDSGVKSLKYIINVTHRFATSSSPELALTATQHHGRPFRHHKKVEVKSTVLATHPRESFFFPPSGEQICHCGRYVLTISGAPPRSCDRLVSRRRHFELDQRKQLTCRTGQVPGPTGRTRLASKSNAPLRPQTIIMRQYPDHTGKIPDTPRRQACTLPRQMQAKSCGSNLAAE